MVGHCGPGADGKSKISRRYRIWSLVGGGHHFIFPLSIREGPDAVEFYGVLFRFHPHVCVAVFGVRFGCGSLLEEVVELSHRDRSNQNDCATVLGRGAA